MVVAAARILTRDCRGGRRRRPGHVTRVVASSEAIRPAPGIASWFPPGPNRPARHRCSTIGVSRHQRESLRQRFARAGRGALRGNPPHHAAWTARQPESGTMLDPGRPLPAAGAPPTGIPVAERIHFRRGHVAVLRRVPLGRHLGGDIGQTSTGACSASQRVSPFPGAAGASAAEEPPAGHHRIPLVAAHPAQPRASLVAGHADSPRGQAGVGCRMPLLGNAGRPLEQTSPGPRPRLSRCPFASPAWPATALLRARPVVYHPLPLVAAHLAQPPPDRVGARRDLRRPRDTILRRVPLGRHVRRHLGQTTTGPRGGPCRHRLAAATWHTATALPLSSFVGGNLTRPRAVADSTTSFLPLPLRGALGQRRWRARLHSPGVLLVAPGLGRLASCPRR
jgi:hypothetical protein